MSSQQAGTEFGAFGNFVERIGIPRPLFWGFVAVEGEPVEETVASTA